MTDRVTQTHTDRERVSQIFADSVTDRETGTPQTIIGRQRHTEEDRDTQKFLRQTDTDISAEDSHTNRQRQSQRKRQTETHTDISADSHRNRQR